MGSWATLGRTHLEFMGDPGGGQIRVTGSGYSHGLWLLKQVSAVGPFGSHEKTALMRPFAGTATLLKCVSMLTRTVSGGDSKDPRSAEVIRMRTVGPTGS